MDSCNFTNKANSCGFEVEINTLQKLCHFGRRHAKAKLFCQKIFVPVTDPGWSVHIMGENFHSGYRDLGSRASPASHMTTSKFLRRKEWRGEISETEPARLTGSLLIYQWHEEALRASSYEPGNRASSVTRTNFVVCSNGNFQPGRPG